MSQFMLLIRMTPGSDEAFASLTPEQAQQAMQMYYDWTAKLRNEGRYISADQLKAGGNVIRIHDGRTVVDGPYVETKEGVGGYFTIEAKDAAAAAEIAKGCPALTHGGIVEVREIVA